MFRAVRRRLLGCPQRHPPCTTAEQIKAEWEAKGKSLARPRHTHARTYRGTLSGHEHDADTLNDKDFRHVPRLSPRHPTPYRTEWVIFDETILSPGTLDFLAVNPDGSFEIYDWKRSTKVVGENGMPIPDKYGKRAFAPISHVADTTFNHYALQLSIYRYILATKIRNRGAGRLIQASSTPTCGATMWWTYPISKKKSKHCSNADYDPSHPSRRRLRHMRGCAFGCRPSPPMRLPAVRPLSQPCVPTPAKASFSPLTHSAGRCRGCPSAISRRAPRLRHRPCMAPGSVLCAGCIVDGLYVNCQGYGSRLFWQPPDLRIPDACARSRRQSIAALGPDPTARHCQSVQRVRWPPRTVLAENIAKIRLSGRGRDIVRHQGLRRHGRRVHDLAIVDAPCSGEGMMRKEPEAIAQWNEVS